VAASSACAAADVIHAIYGCTARAIVAEAAPNHSSLLNAVTTFS
jgi:hypothetical protein